MIAASVTMRCSSDYRENLRRATEAVRRISEKEPETGLVVFGEMITGWYDPGSRRCESIPTDDPALKELCHTAQFLKVNIALGVSELSGTGRHNSLVLLDSRGGIKAVHRKRNLKKSEIEAGYVPGELPATFVEIEDLKTALLICSDAADPETVKTLMRSRLDLIILILADDRDENRFMARCNARLYDAWIVTANRFGFEGDHYWDGHSVISDPGGRIREYSAGKESILFHNIKPAEEPSLLRKLAVRLPLPFIVLGNLRALRSYR